MTSEQTYVRLDGETYRCYRSLDGKTKVDVGCGHKSPKSATAHADELSGRKENKS